MATVYYHAGAITGSGTVVWSVHTRRSAERAEREARTMARAIPGARPIVEAWDGSHGSRPCDPEVVGSAWIPDGIPPLKEGK